MIFPVCPLLLSPPSHPFMLNPCPLSPVFPLPAPPAFAPLSPRSLFDQVGGKCYNCSKEDPTIKAGDILIKRKKTPYHFFCSKASRKLYRQQISIVQDERHAKYGAKAKHEEEKNAAKRKAISVDLLGSDSE